MAVTATLALCTVADVEAELALAAPLAGSALAYLESLIDSASQVVETYLRRGPLAYRADIVEQVRGRGWPRVRLRSTPVRAVDEVRLDDGVAPADTYIIEDGGRTGILFFKLVWPFTGYRTPGTSAMDHYADTEAEEGVRVTYDAGWWLPEQGAKPVLVPPIPDLPRDVRRAVTLAVAQQYRSRGVDRTVESERLLSHSVTYARDDGAAMGLPGFTSEAAAMLRSRRRVVQA